MPNCLHGEKVSPYVQPQPLLSTQVRCLSYITVKGLAPSVWQHPSTHWRLLLVPRSHPGKLPLPHAEQAQLPQSLAHRASAPVLSILVALTWTYTGVQVPEPETQELDSKKCRVRGNNNYPWSACYAPVNTAHDTVSILCCQGTRLVHFIFLTIKTTGPLHQSCSPASQSQAEAGARGSAFPAAELSVCPCWIP